MTDEPSKSDVPEDTPARKPAEDSGPRLLPLNGANSNDAETAEPVPSSDQAEVPVLARDVAFYGMAVTQFLGAFNDNLFKQLMLLLAIGAAGDQQGLATAVFSLPFVLLSGYAGYVSDRFSKRTIIVWSKVGEIVVMLLGMLAFLSFAVSGYNGLLVVLLLMGLQSTFFGPGKYGILPEMLRKQDLAKANGIIVMTTFLAIIFGTAAAGFLKTSLIDPDQQLDLQAFALWRGSMICVLIGVAGTVTSLLIRKVKPADPTAAFPWPPATLLSLTGLGLGVCVLTILSVGQAGILRVCVLGGLLLVACVCFGYLSTPERTRNVLRQDRPLFSAIVASCAFWLVSGIAIQAVNSLGIVQLKVNEFSTSLLAAVIGLGIAIGAVIAGYLSRLLTPTAVAKIGLWGIFVCLILLSVSIGGDQLLGYFGSMIVLTLLGMAAGMFAIPVQVFIQQRPPDDQKGRMIAVMNQANFIAILLSGLIYECFDSIVDAQGWPRCVMFAFMSVVALPLALFYRVGQSRFFEKQES